MAEEQKLRLGRGLAALIGDSDATVATPERVRGSRKVQLIHILPNPKNPRKNFEPEALEELAASIKQKGVIQPITVRASPFNGYEFELIAGERRWRAAQIAGINEIPVHIIEASDAEIMELALIENMQREDLSPIEEAQGFKNLIETMGYSHQDLANLLNKSRSHITNMLRLLTLPQDIQDLVNSGDLSKSAARSILSSETGDFTLQLTPFGLTVREVEDNVRKLDKVGTAIQKLTARSKDPNIIDVEQRLGSHLGLKVAIKAKGEGGELSLKYASLEQLEAILRLLEQR